MSSVAAIFSPIVMIVCAQNKDAILTLGRVRGVAIHYAEMAKVSSYEGVGHLFRIPLESKSKTAQRTAPLLVPLR